MAEMKLIELKHFFSRRCMMLASFLCIFVTASVFSIDHAEAEWSNDPAINTIISTAADNQVVPAMTGDGDGGAIIVWMDARNSLDVDIYAQRIDANGNIRWTAEGVAVTSGQGHQYDPAILSDGSGGAIIAWHDRRSASHYDIYAQRIDANGSAMWATNGVAIAMVAGDQTSPKIAADGSGGAIIAWMDTRNGNVDIYAQRIDADGSAKWATNGVPVSAASGNQSFQRMTADGSGGAIVVWQDNRSGSSDIYAQRVDGSGNVLWMGGGEPISTAAQNQLSPVLVGDGNGGAIVAWFDARNAGNFDIYAQRIDGTGAVKWTADGMALCNAAGDQRNPAIISDGNGGAIVTWNDNRGGVDNDIYGQRINGMGAVQWIGNGVTISAAVNHQLVPVMVGDGSGGAIVAWEDYRNDSQGNIYAQRIDSAGLLQWGTDGLAVCTAVNHQTELAALADGNGGAILAWKDARRDGYYYDLYAQRVTASGVLRSLPVVATSSITAVTGTTATGGGHVTFEGVAAVTARGVCWSMSAVPTTVDSCTVNGSGLGQFTSTITGLMQAQAYHVRAYASSAEGTVYGDDLTFTTYDDKPDPFTFTDQTQVALNSEVVSAPIVVNGIDVVSPISIVGGSYSVSTDGGVTWSIFSTTVPATVNPGDWVKIRLTSSGSYEATTTATLTIGGISDSFLVTTDKRGSIDPDNDGSRYAYGENIGWINFAPPHGPGVYVTDTGLTGYAWGENIGWINMNPTNGGVVNDGMGSLSGYAWGENLGWINFSPTGSGVKIDRQGLFNGRAWGENVGWIAFGSEAPVAYRVKSSWTAPNIRGDVNGDGQVDLKDLVIVFQVMSNVTPSSAPSLHLDAEVNQDGKIGAAEAIYIQHVMSGTR